MFEAVRCPLMLSLVISAVLTIFPPWTVQMVSDWSENYPKSRSYAGRSFLFGDASSKPAFHSWINDRRWNYISGSQSIDVTRLCCEIMFVWFSVFGITLASRKTIQNWFNKDSAVTEQRIADDSEP